MVIETTIMVSKEKGEDEKKKRFSNRAESLFAINDKIYQLSITNRLFTSYYPKIKLRMNTALSTSRVTLRSCHFLTHSFMAT